MNSVNIQLTPSQYRAYECIQQKKNIFITGGAGVGKSIIVKYIFYHCHRKVALTSTTGASAQIIGGRTLHSTLGIGLGTKSCDELFQHISENKRKYAFWKSLELLIIDEVSMLSAELFEKIDHLAKRLRCNTRPFGGIQLLLSGDFLQLPTIKGEFCFESPSWKDTLDETIYLTEIIRQKEPDFAKALSNIRIGYLPLETKELIETREIPFVPTEDGIQPTILCSLVKEVDVFNESKYGEIQGEEFTYEMTFSKPVNDTQKSNLPLALFLKLKIGCQVMYCVNSPDYGLVNGSRGVIWAFVGKYPLVKFKNGVKLIVDPVIQEVEEEGKIIFTYTQIPLKLAWAWSIHKSQGSSFDCVVIDVKNVFECAQFYVALSRCCSLKGLYLLNLNWKKVKVHPKALEYYQQLEQQTPQTTLVPSTIPSTTIPSPMREWACPLPVKERKKKEKTPQRFLSRN